MTSVRLSFIAVGLLSFGACRSDPTSSNAPAGSSSGTETPQAVPPVVGSAPMVKPPIDLPEAPQVMGPLHQRLVGTWAFEPSAATQKKLIEEFKRSLKDPKDGERMSKRFEEGLSQMSIEITPDAMVTKQGAEQVGKERYQVLREEGDRITVRMFVSRREQTLVLKEDGTVNLHDDRMGDVVLRRR